MLVHRLLSSASTSIHLLLLLLLTIHTFLQFFCSHSRIVSKPCNDSAELKNSMFGLPSFLGPSVHIFPTFYSYFTEIKHCFPAHNNYFSLLKATHCCRKRSRSKFSWHIVDADYKLDAEPTAHERD